jgi:hypothetical protein
MGETYSNQVNIFLKIPETSTGSQKQKEDYEVTKNQTQH